MSGARHLDPRQSSCPQGTSTGGEKEHSHGLFRDGRARIIKSGLHSEEKWIRTA